MVTIDTLEGVINRTLRYHYDAASDVLYLRLLSAGDVETYGEETEDGFILLREVNNDRPAGLTIVDWWKKYGTGDLPDSIQQFHRAIEPFAQRLAA